MTTLHDKLCAQWVPAVERCGVILADLSLVELKNLHQTPQAAFEMSADDISAIPNVIATWHTHPHTSGNLSMPDYWMFVANPHLWHYIVGAGGDVRCYYVEDQVVLLHDGDDPPRRLPQAPVP